MTVNALHSQEAAVSAREQSNLKPGVAPEVAALAADVIQKLVSLNPGASIRSVPVTRVDYEPLDGHSIVGEEIVDKTRFLAVAAPIRGMPPPKAKE